MFDLNALFNERRRTYSRRLAVLTSTITDDNELDTLQEIEDLSDARREWLNAWQEVQDLVHTHDDAFALFVESFGMDLDTADDVWTTVQAFNASYIGYMSAEEYAQDLTEGTTDIPNYLAYYIDYEKMGRDMILGGDMVEEDGHLFNANW